MSRNRILIVDDEDAVLRLCELALRNLANTEIVAESQSRRAAERLSQESFDVLVTDMQMPGISGSELIRLGRQADPALRVIVLTGFPTIENAVEAMKLGAAEYLTKPFTPEELLTAVRTQQESRHLREENQLLRRQMEKSYCCGDIIGQSPIMRTVCDRIRRVAEINYDVLIVGETGTGKELVAHAIHRQSSRGEKPFVPVNCGAIPEELMEREFFGHERGAFTGAQSRGMGLLEYAHGGTFFLDELNQLPLRLQGKLLRIVQERKLRRVGGTKEIDFDVRIVAASSVSLENEVRQNRFRADLYHRINVTRIDLPPLRDRLEDIPLLAKWFLDHFSGELKKQTVQISPEAMEVLLNYSWPGNIRELQNFLKRTLAWTQGNIITIEDLPEEIVANAGESARSSGIGGFFHTREKRMLAFEKEYFDNLLREFQGDVSLAAREAQLPRGTLYRLLKKHGLNPSDFRAIRQTVA
jgi:DNA-binding NtrC family response regulator